jgi:O-antigen ligase
MSTRREPAAQAGRHGVGGSALLLLAFTLTVAIGFFISSAPTKVGFYIAGGVAGLVVLLLMLGIKGIEGTVVALLSGAAFLVSMNALRPIPDLSYSDVFIGAAILPILISGMRRRVRAAQLARYVMPLSLAGLVVCGGLLGTFVASDQIASLGQLIRFTVSSVLVLLLFAIWSPKRRSLELVAWALLAGVSTSAALGLFIKDAGGRAVGLANHPNHLGLTCCLGVGTALGLALSSNDSLKRSLAFLSLPILMFGVLASGSRSALLGSGVVVIVFLTSTRQWKVVIWGLAVGVCLLVVVQRGILDIGEYNAVSRLLGDESSAESDIAREQLREGAFVQIRENPVIGGGFESAREAHSIYLQLWAAAGMLGLIFIVGVGIVVIKVLAESRRTGDILCIGLASSYLGYLAAGFVVNSLWDRYLWLQLALVLGLAATHGPPAAVKRGDPGFHDLPEPSRSTLRQTSTVK